MFWDFDSLTMTIPKTYKGPFSILNYKTTILLGAFPNRIVVLKLYWYRS